MSFAESFALGNQQSIAINAAFNVTIFEKSKNLY
jgi:hypothetical protein